MGLAALVFEIFSKEFFGEVPDPFELPTGRNLKYLQINGLLKILFPKKAEVVLGLVCFKNGQMGRLVYFLLYVIICLFSKR